MSHGFNFSKVESIDFGVCYDTADGESFWHVPVDGEVQDALKEMLLNTVDHLQPGAEEMDVFEPAQKYSATERLIARTEEPHLSKLRHLFAAENLTTNASVMRETDAMAFYFAIYFDDRERKIVAVRRATQFKGVIKARNRLVSLVDDSLKMVPDDIFKLDQDFDYIIFADKVWILRPTGFEYTAGIEDAIAASALRITEEVAASVPCVDFSKFNEFILKHKRAARLMASLRARADIHLISRTKLKKECKINGIDVASADGKLFPNEGSEMAFLELMDRRRYSVELIDDQEELYVAPNRRGVSRSTSGPAV